MEASLQKFITRNVLTEDDVRAIRSSQEKDGRLAIQYCVSQQTIWEIRARRTWKHI